MAEVITKLKVESNNFDKKIKDAQKSLNQFGASGTAVGKNMSGLTNILTGSLKSIGPWGAALAVAGAGMKVLGDAFKSNEMLADQWGEAMEGAKNVYAGFLNAINTGDFSGFFNNIRDLISEAKDAYDALDELGTFNAFSQINMQKAQNKFDQSLVEFKAGRMDKAGVEAAKKEFQALLDERAKRESDAYIQAIESYAASKGIDGNKLREVMEGSYGDFDAFKKTAMTGERKGWVGRLFGNDNKAANEAEKFAQAIQLMTDEDVQKIQALGMAAYKSKQESIALDRRMQRIATEKKVDKAATKAADKVEAAPVEGSIDAQQAKVAELQKSWEAAATNDARAQIKTQLDEANAVLDEMMGKTKEVGKELDDAFSEPAEGTLPYLRQQLKEATDCLEECVIGSEAWTEALAKVKEAQEAVNAAQDQVNTKSDAGVKNAATTNDLWQAAAQAISAAGSAMSAIEDPAAKVAGIVAQACASIMLGFAQAAASKTNTALGVFGWIAASLSGLATAIGMVSSIKSVTSGFAEGGMILPDGSPYQGDNIVARLNAGEGVLTPKGIATAEQLQGSASVAVAGGTLSTRIKGGDIIVALDNTNRSRGGSRGTYAYSK